MKERSILMSAPMVRAILDGTKKQTRRVMKPQPHPRFLARGVHAVVPQWPHQDGVRWFMNDGCSELVKCPYGQPGDRLWVRETFQYRGASYDGRGLEDAQWFRCYGAGDSWDPDFPSEWEPSRHMNVREMTGPGEDEGDGITGWITKKIPGIHMPRWASRITLEVTGVRVERLQDISEADTRAEGVSYDPGEGGTFHVPGLAGCASDSAVDSYRKLWGQINGPGSWDLNPWVWVVSFA